MNQLVKDSFEPLTCFELSELITLNSDISSLSMNRTVFKTAAPAFGLKSICSKLREYKLFSKTEPVRINAHCRPELIMNLKESKKIITDLSKKLEDFKKLPKQQNFGYRFFSKPEYITDSPLMHAKSDLIIEIDNDITDTDENSPLLAMTQKSIYGA